MTETNEVMDIIAGLANSGDGISGWHLRRLQLSASSLEALVRSLRVSGMALQMPCPVCDGEHLARVEKSASGYRTDCLHTSDQDCLSEDDVKLFHVSHTDVREMIGRALGLHCHDLPEFAGGHLHYLGMACESEWPNPWTVCYADSLDKDEVLSSCVVALQNRVKRGPGVLISAAPVSVSIPMPVGYVLARPSDLFELTPHGMTPRRDRIEDLLRLRAPSGRGGRPSMGPRVKQAIQIVRAQHAWPEAKADQYRLLTAHWPAELGDCPKRSTMYEHL